MNFGKSLERGLKKITHDNSKLLYHCRNLDYCYTLFVGNHKFLIDEGRLRELYLNKKFSARKIGLMLQVSEGTVRARLRELNIPKRSFAASLMKYSKVDFSGDLVEMAYMIGFRLGDLNVYKPGVNSETIVVRCNTTQCEQIQVMEELFSQYGHITVSKSRLKMNVNCFLNLSFDFLLPKGELIPIGVLESDQAMASFIAGYNDAEGNLILNQGRARLKIDSYDYGILKQVTDWLENRGINIKFRLIGRQGFGYIGKPVFKKDLWRVNINDAMSVFRFIKVIMPYMKHKTRIRQTEICMQNIIDRFVSRGKKYETVDN